MAWVSTFRQSLVNVQALVPPYQGRTMRARIPNTLEGDGIRLLLANPYGPGDISILFASINGRTLSFSGQPACILGLGESLYTDTLPLNLVGGETLDVRIGFGEGVTPVSGQYGLVPFSLSRFAGAADSPVSEFSPVVTGVCLKAVEVRTPVGSCILAFGDSLTHLSRWPSVLGPDMPGTALLNLGISGNQLCSTGPVDYYGPPLLQRFLPELDGVENIRHIFFEAGVNDFILSPQTVPQDIIDGYMQIEAWCAERNLPVTSGTLSPIGGSKHFRPDIEEKRQEVNAWIRRKSRFIDYDRLLGDPDKPHCLSPAYDKGDALHMNQAGAQLVAQEVARLLL